MTAIPSASPIDVRSYAPMPMSLRNIAESKWLYLVPTIGALALGAFFLPNIGIGMALGVGILTVSIVSSVALRLLGVTKEDEDNEYQKWIQDYPLLGTLVAPVVEEGLFRGIAQPLITRAILFLAPAAATAFLGTGFTAAAVIGAVAAAAIFGFAHAFNDHENAHVQAVLSTFSGIALGLISIQFGLGAAIAAHMINNTIGISLLVAKKESAPALSQAQ